MEIRVLAKHGKGVREIAREVGVSRNTVRRYLRSTDAARYRERPSQPGKLSAFEGFIRQRLASALPDWLASKLVKRASGVNSHSRIFRQPRAILSPLNSPGADHALHDLCPLQQRLAVGALYRRPGPGLPSHGRSKRVAGHGVNRPGFAGGCLV